MDDPYDLVVVGGGVIGGAVAEHMRDSWERICVVEMRPELGRGASSAAIGGINPHLGDHCLGPLGEMAQRSRALFPDWVARIAAKARMPVPLLTAGLIQAAVTREELDRLAGEVLPVLRNREVPAWILDGEQAHEREPLLGPDVIGGLVVPSDLAIEPAVLMAALARALAVDPRIDVLSSAVATGVSSTADGAAVTLADGRRLAARSVVVAAGHISHTLLDLTPGVLFPVKGQALEFAAPPRGGRGLSVPCDALIQTEDGPQVAFALPRPDGRMAAGVTFEEGVQNTEPTAWARESILRALEKVIPSVRTMRIDRHWAGIRPGSADGAPVIGPVDEHGRVIAATGHYGGGIALAPITVEMVAVLLTGARPDPDTAFDLKLCAPDRFRPTAVTTPTPWPSPTMH